MTTTKIKPTIAVHTHDPSKDRLPVRSLDEIEAFWANFGDDHTSPGDITFSYGGRRYAAPQEISLPELNAQALRVVYEFAQNEGDQGVQWDQGTWGSSTDEGDPWIEDADMLVSCGTSCCLAGWAAHATGATMLGWQCYEHIVIEQVVDPRSGGVTWVWDFAGEQLGLHEYEADLLFNSENGIERIENFIRLFFYVRGLEAPDWLG